MFSGLKNEMNRMSVRSERLRTLLYISKNTNRSLWIVLLKPHQYINESKIINGVVTAIYNGTSIEPKFKQYIGGEFALSNYKKNGEEELFNIDEMHYVSFQPIKEIPKDLDSFNVLNTIQHLDPFTGFEDDSSTNEQNYYKILSLLITDNNR